MGPNGETVPERENRPEMIAEGGFILKAKTLVRDEFYIFVDPEGEKDTQVTDLDELYVVWFTKTLQNWKALISTTFKDDMYYEVTYNGDAGMAYVDAYHKVSNTRVPDAQPKLPGTHFPRDFPIGA